MKLNKKKEQLWKVPTHLHNKGISGDTNTHTHTLDKHTHFTHTHTHFRQTHTLYTHTHTHFRQTHTHIPTKTHT